MTETFGGDKKVGTSLLGAVELKFKKWAAARVPRQVETYHLTLATIPISALVVVAGFLAKDDIRWLWLTSALIAAQYLTDLLDGEVGRLRNTGLIRWGYFMDHFLDYVFLCSLLIGYSLILPDHFKYLQFFILAIFGAFMVVAYLEFAATNAFRIEHLGIGPTEVRLLFVIINTLLIVVGKTYLGPALPYVLLLAVLGLAVAVYRTQKRIWELDMQEKKRPSPPVPLPVGEGKGEGSGPYRTT